jgi:hypothetical protein
MTPSSRGIFSTQAHAARPRLAIAAVAATLAIAGSCRGIRGEDAVDAAAPASVAPPGVIVDEDSAAPMAPDPESTYIRLLAADAAEDAPASEATAAEPEQCAEPDPRLDGDSGRGTPGRTVAAAGDKDAKQSKKTPCLEEGKECREALKLLRDDALRDVVLDIRVGGRPGSDYPCECRLEGETFEPRRFATTMMTWKAAGYCHKPLYFEDWTLERYGHSHGPLADPFFSAAHFFVTLPVLPYKMGVELPWECVYPVGYYRPGSCAPWTIPAVPISCRGFAVQAATVTGIVFALP